MSALLAAELLKLRTTRSRFVYPLVAVLLTGLATAGTIGASRDAERFGEGFQPDLVGTASVAGLLALVLGIVSVTGEFRHGTITPTLLVAPVRERVLASKAVAAVLAGVAFGVVAVTAVAAIAVPWLTALDVPLTLGDGDVWTRALRVLVAAALWGALGVAFGALVHSQTAALVAALMWLLIGEPLLGALLTIPDWRSAQRFFPGQALDAVSSPASSEELLGPWAGLGVALVYVAVLGALGVARTRSRDITA